MIQFTFSPASNQTALYQITQEGLVIAKPNQLSSKQRHRLPVRPPPRLLSSVWDYLGWRARLRV